MVKKHGMTVIGDEQHREIYERLFGEQFEIKFISVDDVIKPTRVENSLEDFFGTN